MISSTIYNAKKEAFSYDDLMSQSGELLPAREELCIVPVAQYAHFCPPQPVRYYPPVQHYQPVCPPQTLRFNPVVCHQGYGCR